MFVECGTPDDRALRRIKVVKLLSPYGLALVATVHTTDSGERDVRLRTIQLTRLHVTACTFRGTPRRSGYVHEDTFPGVAALKGYGQMLHAVRAVASDAFSDVYTSACALTGRWQAAPARAPWCGVCMDVLAELNKIDVKRVERS